MEPSNCDLTQTKSESTTILIRDEEDDVADCKLAEEQQSVRSSRRSSSAWSENISNVFKAYYKEDKFRGLERRSSVENFGQFGFLVPALALCPHADGADALTQQFGELHGTHRELKLAAAHIDDALHGRGGYGKARSYFKPRLARKCFTILNNVWFQRIMICNSILHSLMIFFEPPSVPLGRISPAVLVLNLFCIILYIFDLVINIIFLTWPVFWSLKAEARAWNGTKFIFVCMFVVDYIILVVSAFTQMYIPQVFRCFRLAVILCKAKNIRHIFMVLLTIGFKLSKVFAIILVFIWLSSCVCVYLFMDVYHCKNVINSTKLIATYNGKVIDCTIQEKEQIYNGTFDHVGMGMLRLFVLLSTENYPEVMLPSIRVLPWNFFLFGTYVFVGVFFLTAIVLAIVVDSYWVFAKKHVKKERARERAELAKAWNLLDPLGQGALSILDEKFVELFRLLKPKNHDEENMQLIEMLDTNEDGEIDSFEWTTMLSQVLGYEFEEEDELTIDDFPCTTKCFYNVRDAVAQVTETIAFTRFILVLIIFHCVLFSFKWYGQTQSEHLALQVIRTIIVSIFMLEGIMRLLVLGKKILSPLELPDVVLILIAFSSNCAWYGVHDFYCDYTTLISCLAVFFRLPFNNSELKRAIEVFTRIAPVMVDLLCLLFIILYLLAAVGMELFRQSPVQKGDHMYLEKCGIGFNSFGCACLVLFQMVTTSNWHEIMNSVVSSTKNYWSSMYFVLAYIVVNMVVMNLFVAIAIEAFNKLASHEEQQSNSMISRHLSDQLPSTAKPSVRKQAVNVLSSFASSIFSSARAEQVAGRRQSLAAPGNSSKRGSIAVPKNNNNSFSEDDKDENNFKGDKRERKLKNRMKEKKKTKRKLSEAGQKVRVVTAFKGGDGADLDLTVGDEVTVIQKTDNWWQGHCKNRVGWFPASHVVMGTVKAIPEYRRKRGITTEPDSDTETGDMNQTQVIQLTREKTPPLIKQENSFMRERAGTLSSQQPGTPPVRGRLKIKKSGDWRKEILGEMTVMNAEELRELNNIMRAELRTPDRGRSRAKKSSTVGWDGLDARDSVFHEESEYVDEQVSRPTSGRLRESRPYSSRYNMQSSSPGRNAVRPYIRQVSRDQDTNPKVPDLLVAPSTPTSVRRASEQRKRSQSDVKKLKVKNEPSPPKAKSKDVKKDKKKGNGEMPDWMVKFVNDKKLTVGDDVKLDESKQPKGRRKSSTTGLTTKTGTGTSRSTSSTLKTGTGTLKSRSTGNIPSEIESSRTSKSTPNVRKKSQQNSVSNNK